MSYVVREGPGEVGDIYKHFVVAVQGLSYEAVSKAPESISLGLQGSTQIMATFLESSKQVIRLLVMIHTECKYFPFSTQCASGALSGPNRSRVFCLCYGCDRLTCYLHIAFYGEVLILF